MTRNRHPRRGVTLVEMLVATAMCILGMWMLTWMFQQATASFSLANAQANLTTQQRMVTRIMTRDLDADKFLDDDNNFVGAGNRLTRVADLTGARVPRGGYFYASAPPVVRNSVYDEQTDTYGFPSSRSGNHVLQLTVIVPDTPGGRLTAEVPAASGQTIAGTTIEVSYFLSPTGTTATGAQLYDLMRVQRLTAPSAAHKSDYAPLVQSAYAAGDAVHEVMTTAAPNTVFALTDLASNAGGSRFPTYTVRQPSSQRYGEDRLLSNVLSMEVKFSGPAVGFPPPSPTSPNPWPSDATSPYQWPRPFDPTPGPSGTYLGNKDHPYDFLPFDGQFDSATNSPGGSTARLPIRITAAQIKIRALFGANARQTTFTVTP